MVVMPVAFFTTMHNRAGLCPAKVRHDFLSINKNSFYKHRIFEYPPCWSSAYT